MSIFYAVAVKVYQWSLGDNGTVDVRSETSCNKATIPMVLSYYDGINGSIQYKNNMIPAPQVVEDSCAISNHWNTFIDLGHFEGTCVSDPSVCMSGGFTWSLWLKIEHISVNHSVINERSNVINSGNYDNHKSGFNLWILNSSQLVCTAYTNGVRIYASISITDFVSVETLEEDPWFHVSCVFNVSGDGTGMGVAYMNGIRLQGQYPESLNLEIQTYEEGIGNSNLTLGKYFISRNDYDNPDDYIKIAFSNLVVTDGILGDDDIQNLYSCGSLGEYLFINISKYKSSVILIKP